MSRPFDVEGLDHVTVTTPAEFEDEVVDWYRTCLGLEEIEKPETARSRGAWFRAGDHEIHVAIDERNPPRRAHFGIVVDRFESMVQCLRDNGCHIEQAVPIPGRHRCFTRDPVGNRIELIAFDEERATVHYEEEGAS